MTFDFIYVYMRIKIQQLFSLSNNEFNDNAAEIGQFLK